MSLARAGRANEMTASDSEQSIGVRVCTYQSCRCYVYLMIISQTMLTQCTSSIS